MTSLPSHGEAPLDAQQKIAKNKGTALYNQYEATSAISFSTIAAEAGDPEAQYCLGEALPTKNHYMNAIARRMVVEECRKTLNTSFRLLLPS